MEKLCYIRISFKRAIKNGYPIYVKKEDKTIYVSDINLKKVEQQYVLTSGEYKSYYDISGRNRDNGSYLYGKIPLIYSNLFYWIIGIIMSSGMAFLTQVKLTGNPMRLFIFTIVLVTWVNLFKYWQKDKLDKWIIEQFNK
jgi:hypothetical protein